MKKTIYLFSLCLFAAVAAMAQNPTPELDTTKNPVKQGDPEIKVLPSNDNYLENHLRIMPDEVPAPVRKTLDAGSQYRGWERATVFKNKKGNRFIVQFQDGEATKSFAFDAEGKPVELEH